MADAQLRAVITAEDRASQVVQQVGNNFSTLDDRLSSVRERLQKVGESMTSIGTRMSAALTAPLVGLGAYGVKAFSDLNEAVNASNVTFGKASEKIIAFGKDAADSVGLSQRAFLQASVPIGASLQNVGLSAGNAADWTLKLTQRAADMASVFNTDVGSALTAIQAGLRGEADPLERFGVGLNETAIKAYAAANGIGTVGAELTNQEKAVARLGLLMEQTNRVQDDFKNTSDRLANSSRIARAELENNAAILGEKLAPIANKIIVIISDLADRFSRLSPAAQNTLLVFLAITAAIGPLLLVAGTLITSITAIATATGLTMTAFLSVLPVIALVVAAIAGLTYAYFQIKEKYGSLGEFFRQTWDAIKIVFRESIDAIVGFFQPLINKINQVRDAYNSIKNTISSGIGAVAGALNPFRASGGAVNPNRSFIVGERGPELFTPSTYGTITSNNRLASGGGVVVNVYGDVSGNELIEKVKRGIMSELKFNAQV